MTVMLILILFFFLSVENGVSWAAHLHLCPGDAADSVPGGKGRQQHPTPATGNHQVCNYQVSYLGGDAEDVNYRFPSLYDWVMFLIT